MNEEAIFWSELAELTHLTQVERFGWCPCEDGEGDYMDCPIKGESCAPSDEWEWKDCDLEGHEEGCYRLVCPTCGDTMNRDCEDK